MVIIVFDVDIVVFDVVIVVFTVVMATVVVALVALVESSDEKDAGRFTCNKYALELVQQRKALTLSA